MGVGLAVGAAVATVGVVGSAITSQNSANAAKSAAATQANAANNATDATLSMYDQNAARLQPYVDLGSQALPTLEKETPQLTAPQAPWNPTQAGLAATPGYQFTLQQGLEATQNGFAAQGLGSSGAAIKGAGQYATGLASSTYNQQYQNYITGFNANLAQNSQIYNMLNGEVSTGENAAAQVGTMGAAAQNSANATSIGAANATAAGTVGAANAQNAGINGITGALSSGALSYGLLNSGQNGGNGGSAGQPTGAFGVNDNNNPFAGNTMG